MFDEFFPSRRRFVFGATSAAVHLALGGARFAGAQPLTKPSKPDASDVFFNEGQIPRLKLELAESEINKLRQNPRAYVHGRMLENDTKEYKDVGVKLKGAAGSFRGVDDRPALTINLNKFTKNQEFHALTKIHLNNSVQDPGYLHELISADIFLAGGVPTARGSHARVWLNNRDLGFYGLKEGYDKTFLKRHFADHRGNLYDGGFCQEIDANLEKDTGEGVDDRSDLKALVQACREGDLAKRWASLADVLDIDNFLKFMALELMTCHWDGYCNNRNNYRIYFDPQTKKAYFFPHGMDQMFADTNFNVVNTPGALVSTAVLQNPEWRGRYRDLLAELLKLFLVPPDRLLARIDQTQARIQPVLMAINKDLANDQANHAKNLKERLVARAKNLEMQNANPDPKPLKFNEQGIAVITPWYSKSESDDAKHEEGRSPDGVRAYSVTCGASNRCVASWRAKVLLATGDYKFQVRMRTANVVPLTEGPGTGAGIRFSGGQRTNKMEGTTIWLPVEHDIQISQVTQEVELVAELRATKGKVWFDANSLRLVKVNK